jgi:hypothetical protein
MNTNDMINEVGRAWDRYGDKAVLGIGVALALLLATTVWRFAKSGRKDRWVDRIAAVLVLAWTSEGMWELATERLGFPVPFAVATFFVAESMILSSAMRATQHRETTGVPGPSGTLVWVLAGVFGFIVALNAGSVVEFALRASLPLAAVGLWWTGLTAERATDTEEMRTERWRRAQSREATWTITPQTLLVRWGLMKPGQTTTTEAQRQHQIRRMVVVADKAAIKTGKGRERALRRLRVMTRTADAAMVAEVAVHVNRARSAEALMVVRNLPTICTRSLLNRPELNQRLNLQRNQPPVEPEPQPEPEPADPVNPRKRSKPVRRTSPANLGDQAEKKSEEVQALVDLIDELGYRAVTLTEVRNRLVHLSKTTAYNRLVAARNQWNQRAS